MPNKPTIFLLLLILGLPSYIISQEIKIFSVPDFDLNGNVKSCLVITDYGKEEYYFDETGLLTKSVTRFNDTDYEMTYYKYTSGELIEKRVENYRDNVFDKATSLANFYKIDTTANRKVTEKIVSYTKKLMEQNVYRYDGNKNLIEITRTNTDGTDEIDTSYDTISGKLNITQTLNGTPLKSVQRWTRKSDKNVEQQVMVTITYLDGTLNTKTEEVYTLDHGLESKVDSRYNASTKKWISQDHITFMYNDNGKLSKTSIENRNVIDTKEYIYQFDGTAANNWVKEIITPDNTYKTRRITYYATPSSKKEKGE